MDEVMDYTAIQLEMIEGGEKREKWATYKALDNIVLDHFVR